jgi:tetratricopeptide (TPR) repeat protein
LLRDHWRLGGISGLKKLGMTKDWFKNSGSPQPNSPSGFSRRSLLRRGGLLLALQSAWPSGWNLLAIPFGSPSLAPEGCFATSRTAYPPQLESLIAKLDPALDDFQSELYAEQIEKILEHWSAAICRSVNDLKAIRADLAETLSATSLKPSQTIPLRDSGPLRIERRLFPAPQTNNRDTFLTNFAAYLSPFTKLELLELEIFGLRIISESPLRIETDLRCDLLGTGEKGSREQRVGSWILTWIRDAQQRWQVDRWTASSEIRSRLTGSGFTEITANCLAAGTPGMAQLLPGIDYWRTTLDAASGIDVYGNHGIAVGDFDGSGFDSFYVCQPSGLPNRLYKNRGDGTFEDITETSGTGILDGTASALFVDFQNRGVQDLLVVRTSGPLLFVNQGNGKFEPRPDAFQFAKAPQGTFTSAAVADYNRDGLLDIYFCVYSYYQGLNQYQFPSPYYDAQNGPPNFLFRNRGDGTFEDVTAAAGLNQNNNRFSFAAAWCDYDNSGWPSLYVANDFGRKNLYHNQGDGMFADVANAVGVEDYGPGMSTCWLDYDNDGLQDVYVANMWLKEGQRITANDGFLAAAPAKIRALYQKHNAGNSFYRNAGKGTFQDKTLEAGSAMGRWSWSCASWDFDNDGYSDLYVANGFVSGSNHHDLQSFFWRQVAQRSLLAAGASPEYEMTWNAVNELVRADYSWSGYQRNVFYANNHDSTFSDVSGVLGLDLSDDSRAYALSDFDHDGRLEFVLKNRTGPQLRIMRNDLEGLGNSIVFRLKGRKSNRDGIGATVTINAGEFRQTKFVSAGSGFASQHTKELFFGVGSVSKPISVSVLWPTGEVEVFENVPLNHRVEIEEGQKEFKAITYTTHARAKGEGALPEPPSPATVSTWLLAPLFGPDLQLPDLRGENHRLSALNGQAVLLSFFRLDCGDSHKQLQQLQDSSAALSAAGLAVLCVAVNSPQDRAAIEEFARKSRITFPILLADEHTAGAWNIQYRFLFDRRRDMPMPTSFLIDKTGGMVRIYQGAMESQSIIKDWNTAPNTPEERFARALPFPGPYYGNAMIHNYFTFGIAFVEYGYVDEAQAAFQRVVDNDPAYAGAWFNLGTIYLRKKQYAEARKCLVEAVRLNPKDADAWNNLGTVSGEEEKYDQALTEFQNAARANPNYLLAVENMMRIFKFQARPADAQQALEELIALAPENADLHLGLAMTLIGQKQDAAALKELQTAVRLNPRNTDAINNLGVVLLRMGQAPEALSRFEECQRLAPDFDRPFINAALIYNSSGQAARARQLLEDFLARHPDNSDVRAALEKMAAK